MNGKYKGIREIVEESIKTLDTHQEAGYNFYSAPEGYELIMSGVAIVPETWKRTIKDFGICITGKKDRIFVRGFDEGSGSIITDDEEPLLEVKKVE